MRPSDLAVQKFNGDFSVFIKQTYCLNCPKNRESENPEVLGKETEE